MGYQESNALLLKVQSVEAISQTQFTRANTFGDFKVDEYFLKCLAEGNRTNLNQGQS